MSHDGSCFLRRPTLALLLTIVLISFLFQITSALPKKLHTHLTGFGCHSASKSIFAMEPTLVASTDEVAHLWVQQTPQGLILQDNNETVCVTMDASSGDWRVDSCKRKKQRHLTPIEGIYGVYKVPSGTLWVLITNSDVTFQNQFSQIRRVHGMELILVPNTLQQLSQRQVKEQARQVRLLRQALRHHIFYFGTNGTDMTRTLQQSQLWKLQHTNDKLPLQPDSRFFWNEPCTRSILQNSNGDASSNGLLSRHVIPVSSAFVGVQANITFAAKDSPYCYDEILISRRSRLRAGTRFTKRGADGTGAVANYAETEQICWLYRDQQQVQQVSSHVQT